MSINTPHTWKNCTCYFYLTYYQINLVGYWSKTCPLSISVCHHLCLQSPRCTTGRLGFTEFTEEPTLQLWPHNHKSARGRSGVFMHEVKTRPRASKCEHVAGLLTLPQAVNRCQSGAASPQNGFNKWKHHTEVDRDQITFSLMCSDLHNSKDIK